jgi:hypothetical protein
MVELQLSKINHGFKIRDLAFADARFRRFQALQFPMLPFIYLLEP